MLGLLVPGRLVDFNPEQVNPEGTQFVFPLPAPESVNHISVFTQAPLPDGAGAGIYICWPGSEQGWHYLGYICNEKPSALFRIVKVKPHAATDMPFGAMSQQPSLDIAQIGVSLEPLQELMGKTAAYKSSVSNASDFSAFIDYTAQNLVDFVGSFAVTQQEAAARAAQGGDSWFPIGCINKWYETFKSKLAHDPTFWR